MKFIKQRDMFGCGPVALVNIFKWAGHPASYKSLKEAKIILNTDKEGTGDRDIHFALSYCDLIRYDGFVRGKYSLKIADICLDNGGCCLASVNWEEHPHIFLIIGKTKTKYKVVNYISGYEKATYVSKEVIKNKVKKAKYPEDSVFYLVSKNEK